MSRHSTGSVKSATSGGRRRTARPGPSAGQLPSSGERDIRNAPAPMRAAPTDAVTRSNGSTASRTSTSVPPTTSAPRELQPRIGPPIGRALTAAAATWTIASAGKSTAARTVGWLSERMAISVGTDAATTEAASMPSATACGREPVRAQMTARVAPARSASSGHSSTGSASGSPTAMADPRTSAAPVSATHPVATPRRRTGTPRATSGRNEQRARRRSRPRRG